MLSSYLDKMDFRVLQILFLSSFILIGFKLFDFSLNFIQVALSFCGGLLAQAFFILKLGINKKSLLSAAITCLGVAVLLRSDVYWIHPIASFIGVSSKFIFQYKHRHFFNPAAFGVFCVLLLPHSWVSPGQWGSGGFFAFICLVLGMGVVSGVKQFDQSFLFLCSYIGLVFIRNAYLGNPVPISLHQVSSGSLLVFSFFMVSDPKTSPQFFASKWIYSVLLSSFIVLLQVEFFIHSAFIVSILLFAPLVYVLDLFFKNYFLKRKPYVYNKYAALR